jgi:hypothetical protein
MKYKIFYNIIYPSIKASFEANSVITRDEYRPASYVDKLERFAILPMTIPGPTMDTLVLINDRFEKLLKEYDIKYAKHLMDFRLPNWYEYELMFD